MKKIKSIILILLSFLIINSSYSEVSFDFKFSDPKGVGFRAAGNEWMMEAVKEGANLVGKCIKQNGSVTINIFSFDNDKWYAGSQAVSKGIDGQEPKMISSAMRKILNEDTAQSDSYECNFRFNTNLFFEYHTLKGVFTHELTHALGFLGHQHAYNEIGQPFSFNDFDQFLEDESGNKLIIDEGWFGHDFKINPKFDPSSKKNLCGPNIKKYNEGNCLKIDDSYSHLDISKYPRNLMKPANLDYPFWNKYELGVMEDLGYQIDKDAYCKTVQNLRLDTYNLTVNMDALQQTDSFFVLKRQTDYPEECFPKEIFHESFSIAFEPGDKLQFFSNGKLMHEFNSIKDFYVFRNIPVDNKVYRLGLSAPFHLTFVEIKEKGIWDDITAAFGYVDSLSDSQLATMLAFMEYHPVKFISRGSSHTKFLTCLSKLVIRVTDPILGVQDCNTEILNRFEGLAQLEQSKIEILTKNDELIASLPLTNEITEKSFRFLNSNMTISVSYNRIKEEFEVNLSLLS